MSTRGTLLNFVQRQMHQHCAQKCHSGCDHQKALDKEKSEQNLSRNEQRFFISSHVKANITGSSRNAAPVEKPSMRPICVLLSPVLSNRG